jgi:hypothetical protein
MRGAFASCHVLRLIVTFAHSWFHAQFSKISIHSVYVLEIPSGLAVRL